MIDAGDCVKQGHDNLLKTILDIRIARLQLIMTRGKLLNEFRIWSPDRDKEFGVLSRDKEHVGGFWSPAYDRTPIQLQHEDKVATFSE